MTYLQSRYSKGLTGVSLGIYFHRGLLRGLQTQKKTACAAVRPDLLSHSYLTKRTPFTTPTFWEFYLDESVGVRGEMRVGGDLTTFREYGLTH
jgi:hypothetical protein